jgi:hypothetical protein
MSKKTANTNTDRKPRATCVLKSLGANRQEALFEYMDGIGDESGHTYKQCVLWLKKQGVETNPTQLCNWRQWYIMRLRMRWCNDTAEMIMEDDKINGQKYSDEDIQRKGNRMFSLLAIHTCDNKAWSRTQSLVVRRQHLDLIERKMEFEIKKYDEKRAQAKEVEAEPEMTPEEKEARINEIMGTE